MAALPLTLTEIYWNVPKSFILAINGAGAAFVWNPPGETLSAGPGDGPDRWAAVGQEQGNI